jgi:hypothetical protein
VCPLIEPSIDPVPVGCISGRLAVRLAMRVPEEHHTSAFPAGEAEKSIRSQRDLTKPFCLALSFHGTHLPVAPPRPWDPMSKRAAGQERTLTFAPEP